MFGLASMLWSTTGRSCFPVGWSADRLGSLVVSLAAVDVLPIQSLWCMPFGRLSTCRSLAERIITELGEDFSPKMRPSDLQANSISLLTQMLKDVKRFKPPDGSCLSPAGEYNLRYNCHATGPAL